MRKVEAAGFPDDNEPLWSTNFKRSIASLMQVELRSVGEAAGGVDNQIYTDREVICSRLISFHLFSILLTDCLLFLNAIQLSLYGECNVHYYSSSLGENQYNVQKDRDLASCPERLGRWRTFIDTTSCPGSQGQVIKILIAEWGKVSTFISILASSRQ